MDEVSSVKMEKGTKITKQKEKQRVSNAEVHSEKSEILVDRRWSTAAHCGQFVSLRIMCTENFKQGGHSPPAHLLHPSKMTMTSPYIPYISSALLSDFESYSWSELKPVILSIRFGLR